MVYSMKYILHLAYQGQAYRGWQRQPNVNSVQAEVEKALAIMCKQSVTAIGCGRTDAGVNASQYFLHIKTDVVWDFDPVFRLNKILPADIAVFDCIKAGANAHAQHDAVARTYDYFIHHSKDPFLDKLSSLYELVDPQIEEMKKATALLIEYQNYHAFCKRPDLYNNTLCQISQASLELSTNGKRMRFRITGNRFLHGMVRLIVGNLLEIGKGKITVARFEQALKEQRAFRFFNAAYPQGLYLAKVVYPYLDLAPASETSRMLNAGFDN